MLENFFPREHDFFQIFEQTTGYLNEAMLQLLKAVEGTDALSTSSNIKQLEIKAKQSIRHSIDQLHESFVTPFDRRHIFEFLILQNELIGLARLVIDKLHGYPIDKLPLESIEIVINCGSACKIIKKLVRQLKKIKHPKETLQECLSLYELKDQNGRLEFQASKELLLNETSTARIMMIREINHDLIAITKKFESISFLIEEIILEYA